MTTPIEKKHFVFKLPSIKNVFRFHMYKFESNLSKKKKYYQVYFPVFFNILK
jgi:hypothetical protein